MTSLKWQSHVSNICKTVSKNIFLMSQLKRYVSPQTLKMFYSSHILTHVSFSSTVWDGCGETHLNELKSLHRRAAKLLLSDKKLSTDEKMKALSILPLQKQQYFNKAVLIAREPGGPTRAPPPPPPRNLPLWFQNVP